MQDAILTVLLDGWLGGSLIGEAKVGRLLTLEEVGQLFKGVCLFFSLQSMSRQLTFCYSACESEGQ